MLAVQKFSEDKGKLGVVFYEAVTSPILSAKHWESFRSRRGIIDKIMIALSDEKAPAIGVCGMGGVGKSTLMKEVMRIAKEKKLFADVAMAVVSQNPDVIKIQGELAVWLGLKFTDDDNVSGRAARLHKRLKSTDHKKKSSEEPTETKKQDAVRRRPEENHQDGMLLQLFQWTKSSAAPLVDQVHVEEMNEKSTKSMMEGTSSDVKQKQVLIVLDDIWRGIDLEEIGIPIDGGAVKLLFTSRKQHVLSSEMGCSLNVFKLEVLKDEEPWRLFESIVGEVLLNHDTRFESIGKEVVEKCSGLPVVLKAIATTLKNCSLSEWEDALVQFKGSKDAYSNLEISYRHLESEELKSLFLLCALKNNARIYLKDLLYYSMGLGLLTGTNTMRSARDKLKALLHHLQDSSLLLKENDQDPLFVYIHDVVREVAIRIASRDQDSLLITDEFKLKEIPRKKLKNCKAISILYVKLRKLPEGWECPELKMFLLYRKVDDSPIDISNSFFEGMKELSVLDFNGCRCDSLPSSIQLLLNLNTLCLDYCSIEDLTIIGKLKQLQILSFRGSEIARLPKEIGELSELKVLNLEYCKLEVIEPQVLGKLTSLEELHLKGSSFIRWENEGEKQPSNAKVSELNNLSNLSIVNIQIHNPSTIPKHMKFGNLVEFIIQIGDVWDWTGDYSESRTLKIKLELCRINFLHEKWVQDLLKHTQDLHLDGIKGWLVRSVHELCLDGFQELKHLHLQNSPLVQYVARSISKWLPCTSFTILESLFLKNLAGLEMIIRGPIASNSFSKLKVIKVIDCGKLKSLFSYSMLKGLSQLEEIEVRDCEAMQVIVTVDSVATNVEAIELEALHRIELHKLPNMVTFCSSQIVELDRAEVNPRSSEIVQDDLCIPANTMFPNDQLVSFPLLKSLILSSLPKLKYIWQNNCPVDQVANMEYLEVSSCHDLLIVIPSSLVKQVTKLETLVVKDCGSLQELFKTSDGSALNLTSDDMEVLSRLNNLELSNLPFLGHIWESNHQLEKVRAFQNLNLLNVVNCSSLINLLPAALLKSLNQLRKIYIKSCKDMKAVVPLENDGRSGETNNTVFESLDDVWLEDLPNMVTFAWRKGGESINFLSLKELYVKECPKMRSFSLLKEDESAPELCFFDDKVLFPNLARLDLKFLKNIRKIWHEEILEESFCQLEILIVEDCQTLVDVIPSINMTAGIGRLQFHNLKEIIISKCTSLEQPIFKFTVEEEEEETGHKGHYYSLSQLEKLCLIELPKLELVLKPDSHVAVGFPNLVEIGVVECQCLIDVFPIATAATLSKLEVLRVFKCRSMQQIFGKHEEAEEEEDETLVSILFPCLHSIIIQNMDSLMSFFSGISCMLGFPSLEVLEISWCSNLKTFAQSNYTSGQTLEPSSPFTAEEGVHYLFDDKVELPNLRKVELEDLSTLQTVWKTKLPGLSICDKMGQITDIIITNCERLEQFIFDIGEKEIKATNDPIVLQSLESVKLQDLPNMVAFIKARRSDESINFSSLKELYVRNCPEMRAFYLVKTEESDGESLPLCFFDQKALLPELVLVDLVSVGSMEKIWHKETPKESFCQIEQVLIRDCQKLVNVFPSNMLGGGFHFQNLKKISACKCPSLEGSFFDLGGEEKKGYKKGSWSLPQLETLWLTDLPNLQHVVEPTSTHATVYSFPNLVDIQIGDNPRIIELFPISTAPTLSKLKDLIIARCASMRHVFVEDMMMDDPTTILLFPCLLSLHVQDLDNLISFFSVTTSVLHFPSLEKLLVHRCPKLKTFVQRFTIDELEESTYKGVHYLFDDKVELPNLRKVELRDLSTLRTVWKTQLPGFSICDKMGQVTDIIIKDCESLEQFIFDSGEKEINTTNEPVVFQSLDNVNLLDLPNMVAFIRARRSDQSINFPSMKEFYVESCPKMRAFYLLKTEESDGESVPLCFFDQKALLPKLLRLTFVSVGSMEKIWQEEISKESFCQIEQVIIEDCEKLVNVFPSNMLGGGFHFQNLKKLSARKCPSHEGSFFDFGGEKKKGCKKGSWSLPQLETLWLNDLPNLQHVVEPTSTHNATVYSFPNLVDIQIGDNPRIIELFPISTAPTLSKLDNLIIARCISMRHVFVEDKVEEDMMMDHPTTILSFPCLRSIVVQNLYNLISLFSVTSSVLHFPSVEKLLLDRCPKLKTFVQRFTIDDELEESAAEGVHYLLDNKVELPNLKKVELYGLSTLQILWKTKLPYLNICDTIGQITEITIKNCESLEEFLFVSDEKSACGEEIKTATNDPAVFHSLANVTLENLPNMVAFIRGRKRDQSINFPCLTELYVESCPMMRAFYLAPNTEESGGGSLPLCFFDHKVLLPKLLMLTFVSVGSMEKIWQEEISKESFCQIEQIFIKDCQKLVNVFPTSNMLGGGFHFQNLKKLCASECPSLEESLFDFGEDEKKKGYKKGSWSLPQLETLWLNDLPNLQHVVEPTSTHATLYSFPNLVDIQIGDNPRIIELFPISTAPTLSKLKDLIITRCVSMRHVFAEDKVEEENEEEMTMDDPTVLVFPSLCSIQVENMDNLISFCSRTSSVLHFQSLEELQVGWCPKLKTFVQRYTIEELEECAAKDVHYLFDDKVELPNLKKMCLYDLSSLRAIWKIQHSSVDSYDGIGQIMTIIIMNCEKLEEFIFESDDSEREVKTTYDPVVFHSMDYVTLQHLPNMVAFVRSARRDGSITFPSLKKLDIRTCPKMKAFYLPNTEENANESLSLCFFDHKVLVPKVVQMDLISMGSIEKIWHDEISEQSFSHLESLIVEDCQSLVKVFPSKYVTGGTQRLLMFENLKTIIICGCSSLEGPLFEFVWEEREEKLREHVLSLPQQLEKLWLFNLPKLEHVIHPTSDVVLQFRSLVDISIADCQSLIDLFPVATAETLSKLEKVKILKCNSMQYVFGKEAEEEEGTIACQFDFSSLEDLEISWCPVLKTFVQKYKSEDIHYLFNDEVQFPNLEKMTLVQLSSLQTIWKNNDDELLPSNSDSCSRLKSLTVSECKDLQHILLASFASKFVQLEELCIDSCGALEEIVRHGDDSEELDDGVNSSQTIIFFFPQLTRLVLYDLPSLRSFFRGSNVSTWSALKEIRMWHCDKVQIFTPKFSSSSNASSTWSALKKVWMWHCDKVQIFTTKFSSGNSSPRQSLFSVEQVIPNLEVLRLVEEDATMIQDGGFKEDILTEVKYFSLACYHNETSAGFPSRFMLENNFQKLERLNVYCSSFEEIFADESLHPQEIITYKERFSFDDGDQGSDEKPLARLTELMLCELHNLKHVWKADMTLFAEILKSIKVLEVWECPILVNLLPTASSSFGNITTIKVYECNGMQELVTSSAATSLLKLTQLDIYGCGMIETVVSPEGSKTAELEEDGELLVICFRELKHIRLHCLPSLTSFSSSANCIFELPSLEEVIVIECPNLKFFSSNTVVAPKLTKVLLTENEQMGCMCWDGDLNTTIQNLPK